MIRKSRYNRFYLLYFNKINYIKFFFVIIISIVALILILDTFKDILIKIFPNIKILLNNLYETLKDVTLFFYDLLN